jgi:hypothetical protein
VIILTENTGTDAGDRHSHIPAPDNESQKSYGLVNSGTIYLNAEKTVCRIIIIFVCRVIKITRNTGTYAGDRHHHILVPVNLECAGSVNAGKNLLKCRKDSISDYNNL